MSVTDRPVGDVVVLDIKGELARQKGCGSVKTRVVELLDQGHLSLLLNLSHLRYMDSSGVGELVSAFITVRNRHGTLKIAAAQSKVTKLLAIAKLDTVIDVFDTEAEALSSFGV